MTTERIEGREYAVWAPAEPARFPPGRALRLIAVGYAVLGIAMLGASYAVRWILSGDPNATRWIVALFTLPLAALYALAIFRGPPRRGPLSDDLLVSVRVERKGTVIGSDLGTLSFEGGLLRFVGERCEFRLRADDFPDRLPLVVPTPSGVPERTVRLGIVRDRDRRRLREVLREWREFGGARSETVYPPIRRGKPRMEEQGCLVSSVLLSVAAGGGVFSMFQWVSTLEFAKIHGKPWTENAVIALIIAGVFFLMTLVTTFGDRMNAADRDLPPPSDV